MYLPALRSTVSEVLRADEALRQRFAHRAPEGLVREGSREVVERAPWRGDRDGSMDDDRIDERARSVGVDARAFSLDGHGHVGITLQRIE